MTGRRIAIPKGFKLGKDGKLQKQVYQFGTSSAIIAKRKGRPKVVSRAKAMGKPCSTK